MEHVIPGFEKRKVTIDLLKHLATLSLGAIALIASFLQALTKLEGAAGLLVSIVGAFFLCIVASVISALILLGNIENAVKMHGTRTHILLRISLLASVVGFLVGAAGLAYLVVSNVT